MDKKILEIYEKEKVQLILVNGFTYSGVLECVKDHSCLILDVKKGLMELDSDSVIGITKLNERYRQ